jgi:hypothetical protein
MKRSVRLVLIQTNHWKNLFNNFQIITVETRLYFSIISIDFVLCLLIMQISMILKNNSINLTNDYSENTITKNYVVVDIK